MPQESTNSNDTPLWSIPYKPKRGGYSVLLTEVWVRTLSIGIGVADCGCSGNRKKGMRPLIKPL